MKNHKLITMISTSVFFLSLITSVEAALLSRLNGNAFYDDVLDITWLTNANLAESNTFGLAKDVNLGFHPLDNSGVNGKIYTNGSMNYPGALFFIDAMNTSSYLGSTAWRLPTLRPINGTSFNTTLSSDGTTDHGTAYTTTNGTDGGWRDGNNAPTSELGHMYYVNLSNLGNCDPNLPYCTTQNGAGINNSGPFTNLQAARYHTGEDGGVISVNGIWYVHFAIGTQSDNHKINPDYVWATASGDISAVPIPATFWLFMSGVLGVIGMARHNKKYSN